MRRSSGLTPLSPIEPVERLKQTVVIYGNCQGRILENLLTAPMRSAGLRIRFLPTFDDPTRIDAEISEEDWANCVLLLEQVSSWYKPLQPTGISANVERVRYPAVDFPVLWPLLATSGDSRAVAQPGYPYGRFPYGDRIINEVVAEGLSGEDAWDAYQARSRTALAAHARQAKLERMRWEKLEASIGVSLLSEVWDRMAVERPAYTYNHPTASVLRRIAEDVLSRSDLVRRFVPDVPAYVKMRLSTEPYDEFHYPVHPIVAENLGLSWWSPELKYRDYGLGEFTYAQFVRRQIDWIT